MMRFLFAGFLLVFACSCGQNQPSASVSGRYFNLKGYFEKEALRMGKAGVNVDKSVSKNNETESKRLQIKNWTAELALFIASDINKPAWKDSYSTKSATNELLYQCRVLDLRTRRIVIAKDTGGNVKHISVFNQTNNALYTSSEQLDYFPDSLYRIVKKQDVLILGQNDYTITGRIIKR